MSDSTDPAKNNKHVLYYIRRAKENGWPCHLGTTNWAVLVALLDLADITARKNHDTLSDKFTVRVEQITHDCGVQDRAVREAIQHLASDVLDDFYHQGSHNGMLLRMIPERLCQPPETPSSAPRADDDFSSAPRADEGVLHRRQMPKRPAPDADEEEGSNGHET